MVGATARRLCRALGLHRVCDLGRISRRPLYVWSVRLAILFARAVRQLAARVVWTEAELVATLDGIFPCSPDPAVSRTLSADVLLLSRRILQSVLGRSAGLCGWGTPQAILR